MNQFDAETNKQLSRAQALEAMFASSGWRVAEEELNELVAALKDISSIDLDNDPAQQIRDRKNLAEGLLEFFDGLKSQVNNAIIVQETEVSTLVERR